MAMMGRKKRLRIRHIIAIAAVWSLVITQLSTLIPTLFMWEADELNKVEDSILRMMQANVDISSFPNLDETTDILSRVLAYTPAVGGAVYTSIGEEKAIMGVKPTLSYTTVIREGRTYFRTSDKLYYDIYFDPEKTGLAFPIITRVNTGFLKQTIIKRAIDRAILILVFSVISTLATISILGIWIVSPIIKLKNAASAATDNPDVAERYMLGWERSDEIGEAARAFDALLTSVSVLYQEELAVSMAASAKSPFGIIQISADGELISLNQAGSRMFGVENTAEFQNLPQYLFAIEENKTLIKLTFEDMIARGEGVRQASVMTAQGETICLVNLTTIRKNNNVIRRHVMTIINIEKQFEFIRELENMIAVQQEENDLKSKRIHEFKILFESCLSIIEGLSKKGQPIDTSGWSETLADRIINTWHTEAREAGLVESKLRHGVLPLIYGDTDVLTTVFRQAMSYVQMRSEKTKPTIEVDAKMNDKMEAVFTVKETPNESAYLTEVQRSARLENSALAAMSVKTALEEAKGKLNRVKLDNTNGMEFTLPTKKSVALTQSDTTHVDAA